MRRRFWPICALLAATAASAQQAAPAASPSTSNASECRDDRGQDRCSATALDAQNALFGLPAIADLNARGTAVRRAFYVDGYGRDLLAISFLYPRGGVPILEIAVPQRGDAPPAPMRIAVTDMLWREVLDRGRYFDRELASPPGNAPVEICLHSWVTRVEASDPPALAQNIAGRQMTGNRIVSRARDSCAESLHTDYAFSLADMALEAMPPCSLISQESQRNNVTRLVACAYLNGDRITAAQASNAAYAVERLDERVGDHDPRTGWLFAENAVLRIGGVDIARGRNVAAALIRWVREHPRARLQPGRFTGIDRDTATSVGVATTLPNTDGAVHQAPLTIRWTRRLGTMVIETIEIGALAPTAE